MTGASRGKFICIEGIDGSGKTSIAKKLATDISAILTREPGGTLLADQIRGLIVHSKSLDPWIQTFLLLSARRDHVNKLIYPALNDNKIVICDRFSASTFAYQGYGEGLNLELLYRLDELSTNNLKPDLTIYLRVSYETAKSRLTSRGDNNAFDEKQDTFYLKVINGYDSMSKDPNWRIVDANDSFDSAYEKVLKIVKDFLKN